MMWTVFAHVRLSSLTPSSLVSLECKVLWFPPEPETHGDLDIVPSPHIADVFLFFFLFVISPRDSRDPADDTRVILTGILLAAVPVVEVHLVTLLSGNYSRILIGGRFLLVFLSFFSHPFICCCLSFSRSLSLCSWSCLLVRSIMTVLWVWIVY